MKNFFWISRLYFKRNFLYPSNYLLIGLPLIFITAFHIIDNMTAESNFASLTLLIILVFQFFSADVPAGWLHSDLKGPTGARILVSGNDKRVFYLSIVATSWLFNLLIGILLVIVTPIFFNIQWPNMTLTIVAIALLSLMTQLIGVLVFYFTADQKASGKIGYLFGEVMVGVSILPAMFNNSTLEIIVQYLPVGLGEQLVYATSFTDAVLPIIILLGISAVLSGTVLVVGKGKNYA